MKIKIAAQMYSLRAEVEADLEGTLKKLSELGFEYIQVDGMRGNDEKEYAALMKKYNLKAAGLHIKHDRFFNDLDGIVAEAELFECKTIYDKYIDDDQQNTEGYIKTKEVLIEAARKLSDQGFRIGLHNPEYDYNNEVNGVDVMEYITGPVNGISIYAEPDTYWMSVAGKDPVEEMKKYAGRMPIVHCKDCIKGKDPMNMDEFLTEVGSGTVDFKSVIEYGVKHGVEYFCVEQDRSKKSMFESMKDGLDYLTKLASEM